jgi:hypothetical protein
MIHTKQTESIVKALLYSDIFHYPLTVDEIFERMDTRCEDLSKIKGSLSDLVENKVVYQFGEFYSLRDDVALALRRSAGNRMADEIMPRAIRRSRLIYSFPFVRAVMISGSLSKNYFDKNGDIDFFIVTSPGKVWLTRGLLALFQRLVLFNSHKYFCVNYYVDHEHLLLDERNIFTATELITLKPICGNEHYLRLVEVNDWVKNFYPQFHEKESRSHNKIFGLPKRLAEFLLQPFAEAIDAFVMKRLTDRAIRKYGSHLDEKDFAIAFKASRHVSKNHLSNYQKKITDKFYHNVRSYFGEMVEL